VSIPGFIIAPFDAAYSCAAFDCGNDEMNMYARNRLLAEHTHRVAGAFALLCPPDRTVHGFFTLSPTEIKTTRAVAAGAIESHPYPNVGGALLGRLAVSVAMQGYGFGKFLVTHAIKTCIENPMRPRCIVVDAKDDALCTWYTANWAFVRLSPDRRRMVLRLR
jgi:GNAT superfamily N-acetyltransferase